MQTNKTRQSKVSPPSNKRGADKSPHRQKSNRSFMTNQSMGKTYRSVSSVEDNERAKFKYINFLDFPGEVADQTLGGLITNLANECIQLIAGNSYSSVVEKLISEKLFLNLFRPLHSYYVVRSLLGEKGLLHFLSNKFTEDNFNHMINETLKKSYFKKCINFPERNSTKSRSLFKMELKCSYRSVHYNYETLYIESKSGLFANTDRFNTSSSNPK